MNLSFLSVRRGVTFAVVWLVVLLFGFISLGRLKLDLLPDLEFPMALVITNYIGASPEDMETLVSRPIEAAMAGIERVEEIKSSSEQGLSLVTIAFEWGTDMDQAETDIRRALDLVEGTLPDDATSPLVFVFSPDQRPVVFLAVDGPLPSDRLLALAEDTVAPRLERVPGIASAIATGGLHREIHVELDPYRVKALGLDLNALVGAVYRENTQEPGGTIDVGPLSFSVHTGGRYASLEDIAEVVVGNRPVTTAAGRRIGVTPVRLGEVARVVDTYEETTNVTEVDGLPSVRLLVRKQSGENTVQSVKGVLAILPEIERDLPAGVRLSVMSEDSGRILRSLGNLTNTGLVGVGITFVVLLVFLRDLRAAAVVASAMPLSLVATFAVMDRAGMTLNILSMAGLALAVGMLVDNAVVVLENIFRLRQEGLGRWVAAAKGARGVGLAVTASTLTTLSVFVPVLFVEGFAGLMFRDMAVTICFALAVSLMVALSFVPLAASRVLGAEVGQLHEGDWFSRLLAAYGRALDWSLRHRWTVVGALVAALVLSVGLGTTIRSDLMARQDNGQSTVTVEVPAGSSLEETWAAVDTAVGRIDAILRPDERHHVMVQAGAGKGLTAIFGGRANSGNIDVFLTPPGDRERSLAEIEDEIREVIADIPGTTVHVGSRFSLTGDADVEVDLRGYDLDVARAVGIDLQRRLSMMPEVSDVEFSLADQQPQLEVSFDRPRLAELGLSAAAVGQAISTAFQGRVAGRFAEGGDEYDIVARWEEDARGDLAVLGQMPVVTPTGGTVPLSTVARVDLELGPVAIERTNQERVSALQVTLADRYVGADGKRHRKDMADAIGQIEELLEGTEMPDGFTWHVGGAAEDFQESFRSLGLALLVSVLLVYLVMASQFESYRTPFVIIFSVPMALIGVVLLFAATRTALDVSSLIGVIMLVGIAVNNGIVMVDAANQFRVEGLDRVEAIARASRLRLRPVLLTSLTTILAMVPLALQIGEGAEQWSGMARAVIGGLVAATGLTLFVVPVLYTWIARKTLNVEEQELDAALEELDRGGRLV